MSNLMYASIVFICLALVSYLVGGILLFIKKEKKGRIIFFVGWGFNLCLIACSWIINKYPPMANIYQVMSMLAFSFLPLFWVIKLKDKINWVEPYFALSSVVPMIGALILLDKSNNSWALVPALQSIWFVPHVFSYMLAYAMSAVAFVLVIVMSFKKDNESKERYSNAIYNVLRICFAFTTCGLFLGAIWADEAWGIYWSWDIKETWSLITWIFYLAYFHARYKPDLKKYANSFVILAFASLIVTFLLVNYFPQLAGGLHSYGG